MIVKTESNKGSVSMHLKKTINKSTNRIYLSIVHGYRDENGKVRSKTVKPIGFVDDLQKQYADPVSHFTAIAKSMNEARINAKSTTITLDMNEQIQPGSIRKNYGSVIYSKIYHELELDRFLNNARRHEKHQFNTESMMRLLVYSRLL